MNILIVGSGGREHALATLLSKSPQKPILYVAPGNGGTSNIASQVNIKVTEFEELLDFCLQKTINLLVVGPELPLVAGITDFFHKKAPQIKVIGPNKEAAQLEGSKVFSKNLMQKYGIPTANYRGFNSNNLEAALEYVSKHSLPIVIKADGLAAGKGVIIAKTHEEAYDTVNNILKEKQFGVAGEQVVIEEFLEGVELSVFILTDGDEYILLPEAKDYKRIGEGDTGPNTGGMGAVSPVPFFSGEFKEKVIKKIIKPTLSGLKEEGLNYSGFIFFGLINCNGEPYVIEYNARLGDPETEAILPRIKSDFVELLVNCADKKLYKKPSIDITESHSCTVVLASNGYPGTFEKGIKIEFLSEALDPNLEYIFHAGTTKTDENEILSSGGRVIAVTALGQNSQEAIDRAYSLVDLVNFNSKVFRKDIGKDILGLHSKI